VADPTALISTVPHNTYSVFLRRFGELSGRGPIAANSISFCGACIEEVRRLKERRIREETEVLALDTSTIPEGEHWYLIDSAWLQRWAAFKGPSGSGPPPGPIQNDALLKRGRGLLRGTDYRGLNRRVWMHLHGIYGGGPAIVRESINLYGPPVKTEAEASTEAFIDVLLRDASSQ
jgi:hypothetical protein